MPPQGATDGFCIQQQLICLFRVTAHIACYFASVFPFSRTKQKFCSWVLLAKVLLFYFYFFFLHLDFNRDPRQKRIDSRNMFRLSEILGNMHILEVFSRCFNDFLNTANAASSPPTSGIPLYATFVTVI